MAVITRKALQTKQAQDITQKAIQRASVYNPVFSQLQQQRTIIEGQQQGLIQSTQETIGDVNKNIYRAQRSQRAQSAALGMVGGVESARAATQLQDQIGYELGNILSQANQGAISIASQQSAINQAEVMNAQQEILDIYADELIASGDPSIRQDIGAQVGAGLLGALGGGLAGLGIGQFGPKVLNFGKGGPIKGTAVGVGAGLLANQVAMQTATIGKDYWSQEAQQQYEENEWTKRGSMYMGLGGGIVGAGLHGVRKYTQKAGGDIPVIGKGGLKAASKASAKAAGATSGFWTTGVRKNPARFRALNPTPLALAMAGIGATIGGLSAGLDKKYLLDYDKLMQSGTAQDFAQMGIDLEAMSAIIKGK